MSQPVDEAFEQHIQTHVMSAAVLAHAMAESQMAFGNAYAALHGTWLAAKRVALEELAAEKKVPTPPIQLPQREPVSPKSDSEPAT